MNNKAQAGAILLVIIILLIVFFMFTSYGKNLINSIISSSKSVIPSQSNSTIYEVPFSLSANLEQTSNIYINQPFTVLLTIKSLIPNQLSLDVSSFGCSFAQKSGNVNLPAYGSDVLNWSFSSSSPQTCQLQFRVCFPYNTSFVFPFLFKTYYYNNSIPSLSILRNNPLLIINTNMQQVLTSTPSQLNYSYDFYISPNSSFGNVMNNTLNSLSISSNLPMSDPIYISDLNGGISEIYSGSSQQYSGTSYKEFLEIPPSGTIQIPFLITTPESSSITSGYSKFYNITLTAKYNFCVLSNYIPINVQSG